MSGDGAGGGHRERFALGERGALIHYEHAHRYVLAVELARALAPDRPLRVLDLACGSGYGTRLLRAAGLDATALDLDAACAREAAPGVRARGERLPFRDASFDLVTCFEAIEHVEDPEAIVAEIARVVRVDGAALVSTPNRTLYSERARRANPFHLRELDRDELDAMLARHFADAAVLGQSVWAGSWIAAPHARGRFRAVELPAELAPPDASPAPWSDDEGDALPAPLYFVALCARDEARAADLHRFAQDAHLLHDRAQRLFGELLGAQRAATDRHAEVESQGRHARQIERDLALARERVASLEANDANLRDDLGHERTEHASLRAHVANLERDVAVAHERAAELERHAANLEAAAAEADARRAELEAHVANVEEALARERERASGVDAHAANLGGLLDEARARVQALDVHAANLESQRDEARARTQELEAHAEGLEQLRRSAAARSRELAAHASALESEHDDRAQRVRELEAHADNLEIESERLRQRIDALEAHAANLESELGERRARIASLDAHVENLARIDEERLARIAGLERHAGNLEQLRAERDERVQGLEAHAANLEAALGGATTRAEEAEVLASELAAARESALQRLRLAETERNRMQEARDAAGRQRDAAHAELERLRAAFFVRVLRRLGLVRDRG
ncbi:MAG: methyltransferase domain-containing protein [Myxococcota bacterium]